MPVEVCHFCHGPRYPRKGVTFVRNDNKVFNFCSSKCHKIFRRCINPRRTPFTKAARFGRVKELKADPVFDFKRKVHSPVKYSRQLWNITLEGIIRISEIKIKRQESYYIKRNMKARVVREDSVPEFGGSSTKVLAMYRKNKEQLVPSVKHSKLSLSLGSLQSGPVSPATGPMPDNLNHQALDLTVPPTMCVPLDLSLPNLKIEVNSDSGFGSDGLPSPLATPLASPHKSPLASPSTPISLFSPSFFPSTPCSSFFGPGAHHVPGTDPWRRAFHMSPPPQNLWRTAALLERVSHPPETPCRWRGQHPRASPEVDAGRTRDRSRTKMYRDVNRMRQTPTFVVSNMVPASLGSARVFKVPFPSPNYLSVSSVANCSNFGLQTPVSMMGLESLLIEETAGGRGSSFVPPMFGPFAPQHHPPDLYSLNFPPNLPGPGAIPRSPFSPFDDLRLQFCDPIFYPSDENQDPSLLVGAVGNLHIAPESYWNDDVIHDGDDFFTDDFTDDDGFQVSDDEAEDDAISSTGTITGVSE